MPTYSGPLNVLQDGQGSVIPVALTPTNVPVGQSITIDVSNLQQPPSGTFGYISGVTVDATGANIAAGIVSLAFDGGYALVRNANGGNTQVYRVSGPVLRLTITNLAWTSGTINFIIWNTQPTNELQSPLTVVASGAVSISGTPTVQFAPSQQVIISSGAVNVGTISGTVVIEPGAHQLASSIIQPVVVGHTVQGILGAATNGTIRTIFLNGMNFNSIGPPGYVILRLQNVAQNALYWAGIAAVSLTPQAYVTITFLTLLAIPFTGGLVLDIQTSGLTFIDGQSGINCVIGYN